MSKLVIIYWSSTGNTEIMANAVADGARGTDVDIQVIDVKDAKKDQVVEADYVALGCPATGVEALEDDYMEPFVESLSDIDWTNKRLGLFGSYDWGDGDWMREWEERMEGYGAKLVKEGVIANLEPEDENIDQCEALGEVLVK